MFVKDTIYALIDANGMKKEPFCVGLVDYIVKTGGTIKPMQVDSFGNAMALKFGDGTMSCLDLVEAFMIKYFKPVEPVGMSDVIKFPKNIPPLNIKCVGEDKDLELMRHISRNIHNNCTYGAFGKTKSDYIEQFLNSNDFKLAHQKYIDKMKNSKIKFFDLEPKTIGSYEGQAA